MIAVISFLLVLIFSILTVRVATVALTLTGLSAHVAQFQARSAFSGSGFTTSESEQVIRHPVRRGIIMKLMLFGPAGIVTVTSTLILSLVSAKDEPSWVQTPGFRLIIILVSLCVIWFLSYSHWIDRRLSPLIARILQHHTAIATRDFSGLLHLSGDYKVVEFMIQPHDWLAGKTLAEASIDKEGVMVLGIERPDRGYIGAPRGDTTIQAGDTLFLYGKQATLAALDERRHGAEGDREHHDTIKEAS